MKPSISIALSGFVLIALGSLSSALADDTMVEHEPMFSQADEYYPPEEMAAARAKLKHSMGAMTQWFVSADRFETQFKQNEDVLLLDAQAWWGSDENKLWLKLESDYVLDESENEELQLQALWSRAISPFFDLQMGVAHDLEPDGLSHAVIGLQGLAPYWFEIDTALLISEKGDISAQFEAEYEARITQRLILQPRAELALSAADVPERNLGAGLTNAAIGLRLRYEIKREFAPYIGIEWQGSFGDRADFIKANGGQTSEMVAVLGLRAWF